MNSIRQNTVAPVADINGKWSFHPKPQTKPITVKNALRDCLVDEYPVPNREILEKMKDVPQGSSLGKVLNTKSYFNYIRLHENKPSNTLCKTLSYGGVSLFHPRENRNLSISELKRISSFPDTYRFELGYVDALMRMGNCVPPNLMKAIALNLKNSPFLKDIETPTVIGTFTGCGGSSLGFHLAGFKELLAVEYDDNAVATFKLNFPNVNIFHGDIATLSVEKVLAITNLKQGELDCLQGIPPCQGFSTAGKRRLNDSRNSLFKEYARLLKGLQPKCFVMENVTGIIKGHMKQSYLTIIDTLRKSGYKAKGQVMNAKYYNVPQSRERVIIVGVRNDIEY